MPSSVYDPQDTHPTDTETVNPEMPTNHYAYSASWISADGKVHLDCPQEVDGAMQRPPIDVGYGLCVSSTPPEPTVTITTAEYQRLRRVEEAAKNLMGCEFVCFDCYRREDCSEYYKMHKALEGRRGEMENMTSREGESTREELVAIIHESAKERDALRQEQQQLYERMNELQNDNKRLRELVAELDNEEYAALHARLSVADWLIDAMSKQLYCAKCGDDVGCLDGEKYCELKELRQRLITYRTAYPTEKGEIDGQL